MRLIELLEGQQYEIVCGNIDIDVNGLSYNTKTAKAGDVFVCIKGYEFDAHGAFEEIISLGVRVVVVENTDNITCNIRNVVVLRVEDTKKALAILSANYFENPQKKLTIIGITGTSGKTTTAYMIKELLTKLGVKTGLIGTIEVFDGRISMSSVNTTPASYEILQHMRKMVDNGCKCVVMEVSSQALKLDRVYGIRFNYGLFTNISPDHIGKNEHDTFEEYISCKMKLVEMCDRIIVNIDDEILKTITMQPCQYISTVSVKQKADYRAYNIEYVKDCDILGMKYSLCYQNVYIGMSGIFNVYNSMMALATVNEMMCRSVCAFSKMISFIAGVKVKGRLQYVKSNSGKGIIIDYAHNGYSMEKLLTEISKYKHNRMIVIFGCGGNRSKDRRYEMGKMAALYSDIAIITSDNPRWEEPLEIIKDIEGAFDNANKRHVIKIIESDRFRAIKKALSLADDEDLILLIGKGHEAYQEIKGKKYPLDEVKMIATC